MVIPTGDRVIIHLGTLPNGKYYEQGSMSLQIGGETWVLVDTLDVYKRQVIACSSNSRIDFQESKCI